MAKREELKITIIIKGDHIFLGAQATDCDPKMLTMKGDLPAVLARVPTFVAESNTAWDVSARNPKAVIPEPVSTPTAPRTATTSSAGKSSTTTTTKAAPPQPKFF